MRLCLDDAEGIGEDELEGDRRRFCVPDAGMSDCGSGKRTCRPRSGVRGEADSAAGVGEALRL